MRAILGQGVPFTKLHQPKTIWGMRSGTESGIRQRLINSTQALAHAHAKGQGAFYKDANVRRRSRRCQKAHGQSIQGGSRETHAFGKLSKPLFSL